MFGTGCLKCGHTNLYKHHLCRSCYDNLRLHVIWDKEMDYVDDVLVGAEYVGLMREIIKDYKFNDKVFYYKMLGDMLTEKLFASKLHREYHHITYVPMHEVDLKNRGYNQSKILAQYIADNSMLKLIEPIEKIKLTPSQVDVSSVERLKNLDRAFIVREEIVQNVIIVDDVITTGSTVEEIAKTLKASGVKKVAALVTATHNI